MNTIRMDFAFYTHLKSYMDILYSFIWIGVQ